MEYSRYGYRLVEPLPVPPPAAKAEKDPNDFAVQMFLSGHMYRNSPYESDNSCGNCNGARCGEDDDCEDEEEEHECDMRYGPVDGPVAPRAPAPPRAPAYKCEKMFRVESVGRIFSSRADALAYLQGKSWMIASRDEEDASGILLDTPENRKSHPCIKEEGFENYQAAWNREVEGGW